MRRGDDFSYQEIGILKSLENGDEVTYHERNRVSLRELDSEGLLTIKDGIVTITDAGKEIAREIVTERKHKGIFG